MSLERCSMSSAVIGSPLTMTTTCWARAGVASAETPNTRTAAASTLRQVLQPSNIIRFVRFLANEIQHLGASLMRATEHSGSDGGNSCRCSAAGRSAKCAQADLHHVGVVHRHAAAVCIACNIIKGQDEAVVDVSHTHLGLGERIIEEVVSGCPHQHPVRVELEPCAAEDALAAVQESDQRLGGIVSVHHCRGPTAEAGDGFEFGALQREVVL